MKNPDDSVRLVVLVPEQLRRDLRVTALSRGTTMGDEVAKALEAYLTKPAEESAHARAA
jgi:hypothetical protein